MKDKEKRDALQIQRSKLLGLLQEAVGGSGYQMTIYEPSVHPFEAEVIGIKDNPRNGKGWVYTGRICVCFDPVGLPPVETSADKIARLQKKLGLSVSMYEDALNAKTKLLNGIYDIIENAADGNAREKLVALWKQEVGD